MSIQRLQPNHITEVYDDNDGILVWYEDHLAEIESKEDEIRETTIMEIERYKRALEWLAKTGFSIDGHEFEKDGSPVFGLFNRQRFVFKFGSTPLEAIENAMKGV